MIKGIWQLTLMQWRVFFREPGIVFWAIFFPILLSGVLGFAFRYKQPQALPLGVLCQTQADFDRLAQEQAKAPLLKLIPLAPSDAGTALRRGKIVALLLQPWDPVKRRFQADPSKPETELLLLRAQAWLDGRPSARLEPASSQGSRYIDFLVPGLLGLTLLNSGLWGVGWMLIDIRRAKFLRRMTITPMRPWQFFSAIFLSRLSLSVIEVGAIFGFAYWLFAIPLPAHPGAFAALFACSVLAFAGLGALLACRTSSPQVGQGLINAASMPPLVFSGIFFSVERFPEALQRALHYFPPTLMVDAFRAVINEGAGLAQVSGAILALGAMGLGCLALALRFFKWY